jgi:hypothetical protein
VIPSNLSRKIRKLPPFDPELKLSTASVLERFVYRYEPELKTEVAKFRRDLLAVLNGCGAPYDKWVDGETSASPAMTSDPALKGQPRHTPLPWVLDEQGDGVAIYSQRGSHCVAFFNNGSKSRHAVDNCILAREERLANAELVIKAVAQFAGRKTR